MLESISVAVTSLTTAGQIAKGLFNLHTMAEVQAKAIELNTQIIDAQHRLFAVNASQAELVSRVRELESQIAQMKDWEAQKQRYKLAMPFTGGLVYALQRSMSEGEPPHYLCAGCFQKGQKSILQGRRGTHAHATAPRKQATYFCGFCEKAAHMPDIDVIAPQYFEEV